jgi:hypothetical protein
MPPVAVARPAVSVARTVTDRIPPVAVLNPAVSVSVAASGKTPAVAVLSPAVSVAVDLSTVFAARGRGECRRFGLADRNREGAAGRG